MDNKYETAGNPEQSNTETGWENVAAMADEHQNASSERETTTGENSEIFRETEIGSRIEEYKQRGEICPAYVFSDGIQHADAAEELVSLTEDKIGLHSGCRENAMWRAFDALSSGEILALDSSDMAKCLDTITNNGHPENGLKIQDIIDGKVTGFNKVHLEATIPVVEMLLKNHDLYEGQVKAYKEQIEQEYKAAVQKEIELSHEITGLNCVKVMEKIGRYDYYDENDVQGEISFEVDGGKMAVNTYEDCSDEEKKLILAINRKVECVWYEKSRNRGLGVNTETPSMTLEDWIKEAEKESIPNDRFLSEALEEVGWPDNYELVDDAWAEDDEEDDGEYQDGSEGAEASENTGETEDAETEKHYEKLYYEAFKDRKHR